jgi:hypothetical protein
VEYKNTHQRIIPVTLIQDKIKEYIHSEDLFENFFALYLVTGMRKREIIDYSNISKSEKYGYICIDKILKKRNNDQHIA